MSSLNFQEWLAGPVERGEKTQTIRAKRKRPIVIGETLYLFTGMRTKACRRLGTGRCIAVADIVIRENEVEVLRSVEPLGDGELLRGGVILDASDRLNLAIADGFKTLEDFTAFFAKWGLPFEGDLIGWELPESDDE